MEPMRSSSPLARLAQSERENRRLRDESHSSARALGNSTISRGVLVVEEDGSIVSDSTTVGTRIVEGRVEVRQSPEDEWIPILDPSNLPDPTDGLPPTTAPVPVALPFAVGAVQVSWPDISNPDPVLGYEVAAKSTTPVPTDGSATLPGLRGSGTTLSELSGVDVPTDGSPVYVTVRAVDADGPGPWSVEVSAAAQVVDFEQVSQAIKDSIIAADDKAIAAQGDATTAITDALAAANAAATADGKAVSAASKAVTADGKAVAAQTDADQAIADALAAAAAAQTAQNVADDAIRTWYQATAPTGLNDTTDLGDLWFDTDDNQAYRWGGSGPGWILIQDNAISVALANAATAQDAADAAQAKADAAATPANVEAARIAAEAAAALDATTKAEAVKAEALAATAAVGGVEIGPSAPVPEVEHRWTDTADASTSEKLLDGVVTRTNIGTNPRLGVNATGWYGSGGTRVAQGAGWAFQVDGSAAYPATPTSAGTVGQFWSGSVVVSGPAGRTVNVYITSDGGATHGSTTTAVVLTGTPQTVALTSSGGASGTGPRAFVYPTATGGAWTAGQMLTATDALIEQVSGVGVAAGDYFDGATPDELTKRLWIDTTLIGSPATPGNVPKRWDGSTWVAATDKVAVDAAAAAATADAKAVTADGKATDAQSTADAAETPTGAQTKATAAQTAAINAAATDATTKANNAEAAAEAAAAITAQAKADLAKSQAIDSAASTAQTKADVAKDEAIADAAIAAQTKADDARDAAISDAVAKVAAAKSQAIAAAKVESDKKGKVIIQSAAPDVADRLVQNLWIDTTPIGDPLAPGNVPKKWTSGTTWVAVTDKAATDAAAAAVVAKDAADAAQADATTAIDSANGKNTRRSGPAIGSGSTPTTPVGAVAGDTYWGRLAGVVKQQWVYDGTTWAMETVDVTLIANLDSDFITARLLEVDTVLARIIAAGEITTGELAAGAVTAAKIQGQAIDGMVITGSTLRTAAAGLRTQLDSIGLRTFDAAGAESARLSADSGGMRLSGTLDMRDATGTGLRIDPDDEVVGSAIRFFENDIQVGELVSSSGGAIMRASGSGVSFNDGLGYATAMVGFTVQSDGAVNIVAPNVNFAASESGGVFTGSPTVTGLEENRKLYHRAGTVELTTGASSSMIETVLFGGDPMASAPVVLAGFGATTLLSASANVRTDTYTATGFRLIATGLATSTTYTFVWVATIP